MQTDLIISGFGGQGTLYAGQLLSYAAMDAGKFVTWIPSYGPEMRGGTANCTVVVSDDEIGSPTVLYPTAVLAMNLPSLDKYEMMVKTGGWLIVNESMVNRTPTRKDIHVVMVPANKIAQELGNERATNMVMLGVLLGNLPILPPGAVEAALEAHTGDRMKRFIPSNIKALEAGYQYTVAV